MGLHDTTRDGTVGKALNVLEQVADFGRPVRFSELLDGSPYPKGTLYRLVQTLTSQGMLTQDCDLGTYSLGLRLVRLAHTAWQQSSIAPLARPHLEHLSFVVGETVHLAQLDNAHVLYLDKLNAHRQLKMYSEAGKIGPAYCTGVGKVMLAHLPPERLEVVLAQQSFHPFTDKTHRGPESLKADLARIAARGYAFDDAEHEEGVHCIAMPILSPSGHVRAAISVSSRSPDIVVADLEAHAPRMRETIEKINRDIADWRFPDKGGQ